MNHIPFLLATASAVFTPFCAAACPAFPDGRLSGHMAVPSSVKYEANTAAENEADTLRQYEIDEAVVVASPKETSSFNKQPVSVTLFSKAALQRIDAQSIKSMANFAPNFFMSNYGSRLSSAVYIRGIGSRINTPAVGLYVDNIPYVDKSAYDFSFLDVTRVDVLRGPQGTLYGRFLSPPLGRDCAFSGWFLRRRKRILPQPHNGAQGRRFFCRRRKSALRLETFRRFAR